MENPSFITTTFGMRGYFAVMMWWNPELGGFYEPYTTSDASFKTQQGAVEDAKFWARAEGLEYRT